MSGRNHTARNRKNAKRSTGTKSSDGKKKVSKNALRHGATARPSSESTMTWLRVITNDPAISLADVTDGGDQNFRAFVLAEAEARLRIAQDALTSIEIEEEKRIQVRRRALQSGATLVERFIKGQNDLSQGTAVPLHIFLEEIKAAEWTKRLLESYFSEAKSWRKKAFRTWIEAIRKI
jgi:hypothetical protein